VRIRLIQPPLVQPRYRQLTLPVVGAELAAAGLEVQTCDENVEPLDLSPVDLVGISCHVYNAPRAFDLAARFRRRGTPVILGGTFPTVAPELCQPHADAVVVGELEGQSAALARDVRAGTLQPLYRAGQPPDPLRTARPDWSLIDSRRYLRFNFPLEVSRGCRFNCAFCTTRALYGRARTRPLADIERDLDQYDHGLVELVDVNFLDDARAFGAVLPLLERAKIPGWTGQTSVADLTDPALPERLARSRCRAVFVGLESISRGGLRSVNKAWSNPDDFMAAARRLSQAGVLVQAGVIVGLEHQAPGDLSRLADFLERARVQSVTVTYLHFYPGTEPYERLRREGRLLSANLEDYDGNRPTLQPRGISVLQLEREVSTFLERIYAGSSVRRRALHGGMLRRPTQLVHHWFVNGALGHYYRELAAEPRGGAAGRYQAAAPAPSRLDKLATDTGSWMLDRLLSLRR
jgi:radical SAM superfamily enzyme YgiQ (UPF0313 family)